MGGGQEREGEEGKGKRGGKGRRSVSFEATVILPESSFQVISSCLGFGGRGSVPIRVATAKHRQVQIWVAGLGTEPQPDIWAGMDVEDPVGSLSCTSSAPS